MLFKYVLSQLFIVQDAVDDAGNTQAGTNPVAGVDITEDVVLVPVALAEQVVFGKDAGVEVQGVVL